MSYRRNERHGTDWSAGAFRDPYEERGGRHPAHRPNPVNRRQLVEQLYDVYDDDDLDGQESDRER